MHLPKGLYLSPMVRGSELAMRMLAREHGNASLCYSPMLRDKDVISVHQQWKETTNKEKWKRVQIDAAGRTDSVEETAYLLIHDTCTDDTANCVVQLCGSSPESIGQATAAVLDLYANINDCVLPAGIDLNLGCPQQCASDEGFGAFLVERNPEAAISCISSMRSAIDSHCIQLMGNKPTLSAKIRLMKSFDDTLFFIRKLHKAGIDYIAIHCRLPKDKHDGGADWDTGRKIVAALESTLPVILNGGVCDYDCATSMLKQTNCHAVMIATGYLHNHRNFHPSDTCISVSELSIACEYLDYAEMYPPPSYLYIQKHLRWILRHILQPSDDFTFDKYDFSDPRVKLWTFLVRPYLRSIAQFRLFLALCVKLLHDEDRTNRIPESISSLIEDVSFKIVKEGGQTNQ
eukprot:CCRYP_008244-RB/>CCRYP_008244-RB protein AED:0.10 eAED:0.10 QI:0/-1/0/1/-1/1/1/0/402